MSKWSIIGGVLCIAGLVLYGFQMLSSLMGRASEFNNLCVYDFVDSEKLAWIEKLTWFGMNQAVDYLASAPLYIMLLVVGGISLVISGFIKT
jgi:hypothetical protein